MLRISGNFMLYHGAFEILINGGECCKLIMHRID
jgi:hypothetical protein